VWRTKEKLYIFVYKIKNIYSTANLLIINTIMIIMINGIIYIVK